jgi:hypothetical protein
LGKNKAAKRKVNMPSFNHIHKYIAATLGGEKIIRDENGKKQLIKTEGYKIFKCSLENCTHYLPRVLAIGAKTICWDCGEETILNKKMALTKKPKCMNCRLSKEKN